MIREFETYSPQIAQTAFIDPTALVIGQVTLGEHSSVWPMTVVRGDINQITIGNYTNIQDGSVIHVTHQGRFNETGFATIVGDQVTVGHRVVLHGCHIGNLCLIGMNTCIMDGAVLEDQVILGAGSLVTPGKVLTAGYLWVGSPARKVRPLTQQERDFLRYSAEYYAKLKNRHLPNMQSPEKSE